MFQSAYSLFENKEPSSLIILPNKEVNEVESEQLEIGLEIFHMLQGHDIPIEMITNTRVLQKQIVEFKTTKWTII
ncbi:16374_t:CDS:2 [Gigaspora margarita]|uniref:16374_t:CDS:1 n=1 Tax=Gigaspora margarita TaxID=4874 RepID=A0ABN7UCV0_GIGMA|nr:16374_t:CDS:2 [Gigaspora margarita]